MRMGGHSQPTKLMLARVYPQVDMSFNYPKLFEELSVKTVDDPDLDHPLWEKIWSTAKCEMGVLLSKSPSTSFIPYQCCPVVDCHFGPKKLDRHPTQQPNGYKQDRFLKHWQAAHQFESWYAICRNCCHIGRWRDEIKIISQSTPIQTLITLTLSCQLIQLKRSVQWSL